MSYQTKYYVNEEKRTVVCVLTSSEFDVLNYIGKNHTCYFPMDEVKYIMPRKYVGIAKCSPEDTFDEHIGSVVAFDRAKFKYDKTFISTMNRFMVDQAQARRDFENRFDKFITNAANHHYNREDEIEAYLNR